MASEVDISNLALAHLGDSAIVQAINPPDGSRQAELCQRFYPVARDNVLQKSHWRFNKFRSYALSSVVNPSPAWLYAYALPNQYLDVIGVYLSNATNDSVPQPYIIEQSDAGADVLYTSVLNPQLVYKKSISDTQKFSPLFVSALSWWLGSYLAGPILKGKTGVQMAQFCMQQAMAEIGAAAMADSNSSRVPVRDQVTPSLIAARS